MTTLYRDEAGHVYRFRVSAQGWAVIRDGTHIGYVVANRSVWVPQDRDGKPVVDMAFMNKTDAMLALSARVPL